MKYTEEQRACRCHAHRNFQFEYEMIPAKGKGPVPAHTFPWAKTQYPVDRPVWPLSQSLDLVLDIEKEELWGSNSIKFRVVQREVSSFEIDAIDLRIHEVQINGAAARFEIGERRTTVYLTQALKRGDLGEVKLTYTCHKPKAGIYFIKPDSQYPDRPTQVWTQGQDDDSRYWFPSFDEPRVKCSLDVKVEVPAGYIATSNGALQSESRGGKTWTFVWRTSVLIPSYLVTLTVGKFAEIKDDWRGKPVTYLFERGREVEAKLSFGKTPQMMELFSQKIGVDYPYEKYAQIAAAEFIFGGMENTSATTQTDMTLHPYEIEDDFSSDDLVAHELAHQWFGDLVTCKSWAHGWLNEGWATFMETVFKEHDLGRAETEYFRYEEFEIYENEDKGLYRRPVVTSYYADPGEVWDRHIYQKGGLILNMLRAELGDEDFWLGTKNYLNTFKGSTVETVDFQRALESASGRSLQEFFDQWIFKGGYPQLKASFEWDEKTKLGKFKLSQTQDVDDLTPLFNFNSQVEFVFGEKESVRFPLSVSEKEQSFYFPLKTKPKYLRFDVGNNLIKTLDWALPLEFAKAQLASDDDVVGKIWALKTLAKEATKEGVEVLIHTLKTDTFWGVRAEAALALGSAKTDEALTGLTAALKTEKRSRVRTRICNALGNFRDERAALAVTQALGEDKSIFVRGSAAQALGKTKSPVAFDQLKEALKIPSWNDHIRAQSFIGLRHLRDERALDLFIEGAKYGAPKFSRLAAVAGLGEFGLSQVTVTDALKDYLDDPFFRVRFAAAEALVKRKDPGSIARLEDSAYRVVDGHFKAAAFRAARRLRDGLKKPEELQSLKEALEKSQDEQRKLKARLDRIEAKDKLETPPLA